jgi:hypothetical protein
VRWFGLGSGGQELPQQIKKRGTHHRIVSIDVE